MARDSRGLQSALTPEMYEQVRGMLDRKLSQREIARAVGKSQPTICRMAKELRKRPRNAVDGSSPESFVNSFDVGLTALCAIDREYLTSGDMAWRDSALAAYKTRFPK